MKNEFPGYFRLSEAALKKMWRDGLFVFDASFLLNFYRYSKETRGAIGKIISSIHDRVWVPHQAALEFLRNRLIVIADQEATYEAAQKDIKQIEDAFKAQHRHPFISEVLLRRLSALFVDVQKDLEQRKCEFARLIEQDEIEHEVTSLFEGKIGAPFQDSRIAEIAKEGERRYREKIPPGYQDGKKEEGRRYGDLLIWLQIMDNASNQKNPIISLRATRKKTGGGYLRAKRSVLGQSLLRK